MDRVHGVVHGPGPQGWSMDPGPCFVYVRVAEWFRALDLKSRGPRFKSSTLPLNWICFLVISSSTHLLHLVQNC